jgi:hypothetical protein
LKRLGEVEGDRPFIQVGDRDVIFFQSLNFTARLVMVAIAGVIGSLE